MPQPTGYLIPVTGFMTLRDDVRLAELDEVLVPASYYAVARRLLPSVRFEPVAPDSSVLARVRGRSTRIALVPPSLVDASVKTLSLDGQFFWDPQLDLARYPLRMEERPEAAIAGDSRWEMVAAGEMIFGRGVQWRIEERFGGDARPAFAKVKDILRGADLAVATLEAPLSGSRNRYCDSCVVFVGNEAYVAGISDAGIDLVTLAANHIGDGGPQGVLNTIRVLDAAHVAHVGAGADLDAAHRPAVVETKGLRIAFLGYTDVPPIGYSATATRPGHAWLSHEDPSYAALRAEVALAKRDADLLVVMNHWGIEYEEKPRPAQMAAARAMVDAGADIVVGDHPHWVQSVELYHEGYIAYSVGNFVFDQMWSMQTREGSLHRLFFGGDRLMSVRIVPTLIEDYYQPRLLAPGEPQYRETLERIWRNSFVDDAGN
jgi:poly-gamma-glutamate synthesis protein (capsule biosynthesis protein)